MFTLNNRRTIPPDVLGEDGVESVYIEPDDSDEETKTVKVKLPADLYLKLHSLKVLEGGTISERVEAALEAHFEGTPFADMSENS